MNGNKYNPERVANIIQAIELGATFVIAANSAGVSENTFYRWMKEYPEFDEAVNKAASKAAIRWLAKIEQAASQGNWQAAAWKLERRFPRDYGRHIIEHDGAIDYVIDLAIPKSNQALNDDRASTPLLDEPKEV